MNQPMDVHPEDLLDREQHAALSPEERRRLNAHCERCAVCAMVREASIDFGAERVAGSDDDAIIARLVEGAVGPAPSTRSRRPVLRRRRARGAWLLAAASVFAATAAMGAAWKAGKLDLHRLLGTRTAAPAPSVDVPTPSLPRPVPHAAARPPAASTSEPDEVAIVPESPPDVPPPSPPVRAKPIDDAPMSANQLFARANDARRRRDSREAIQLYTQLQRQFPGSREETTSRVLLGRLLLDRGDDANQALALFTRYLSESPNGTLAEEARLGRALALMRLGRTQEERQAWQQLLSAHPNSIHADRAQKRLDELR